MAQFPLGMGKKKTTSVSQIKAHPVSSSRVCSSFQNSKAVVPLQLDASGQVKFDALARLGQDKDKVSQKDAIYLNLHMVLSLLFFRLP